jgi:hypothetical protein
MVQIIEEVYEGVHPTTLEIVHEKSRLKSEYVCYADFECESWSWKVGKPAREDPGGIIT